MTTPPSSPALSEAREQERVALADARKAIHCLSLEVDQSIVLHVRDKVECAIAAAATLALASGLAAGREREMCACEQWEPETAKLNAPLMLAQARNPHLTQTPEFAFKAWEFCPWCGGKSRAALRSPVGG